MLCRITSFKITWRLGARINFSRRFAVLILFFESLIWSFLTTAVASSPRVTLIWALSLIIILAKGIASASVLISVALWVRGSLWEISILSLLASILLLLALISISFLIVTIFASSLALPPVALVGCSMVSSWGLISGLRGRLLAVLGAFLSLEEFWLLHVVLVMQV